MPLDEDEIKQRLGIDTWRNLSKDKMLQFAALMPEMDTKLAMKIVEQFPVFKEFATQALGYLQTAAKKVSGANSTSQEHVFAALAAVRERISAELERDDLTWDQRLEILALLQENARMILEKDSENKSFLSRLFDKLTASTFAAAALAVVVLGGRVALKLIGRR